MLSFHILEVTVVSKGVNGTIAIGVSKNETDSSDMQPGWTLGIIINNISNCLLIICFHKEPLATTRMTGLLFATIKRLSVTLDPYGLMKTLQ